MPKCVLVTMGGHYRFETTVEYDEETGKLVVTNDLRRFLSSTVMRNGGYGIGDDGAMQLLVQFYSVTHEEGKAMWLETDNPFRPYEVRVFPYDKDAGEPEEGTWETVATLAYAWADDYCNNTDDMDDVDPAMRVGMITNMIFGPAAPWASTSARILPLTGWSDEEVPREAMLGWQLVFDDDSVLYVTPFGVSLERPKEAVTPVPLHSLDQLERPLHLN